jgi:uncharacterized protein (TIGR02246 family)
MTSTAGSDAGRQAVAGVLARSYQAWEVGDAGAFAADYTEDASVIRSGVYEKDREEIRTNMAAAFASRRQQATCCGSARITIRTTTPACQ